ncbi:MAG TPA: DUF4118 domain-containing protein [Bryobacteraceae bacterium]|nr:DUF4118 domain-containing protein [Bryobacteraceae bacterium]
MDHNLGARNRRHAVEKTGRDIAQALAILALCTMIALGLRRYLAPTNLAMIYLLGVVAIAMRGSRGVSAVASVLGVAAFDFFCIPPYSTFAVSDSEYVVTFAAILAVALVIGTQTSRIRQNADQAVRREARTNALYRLSHSLSEQNRVFDAARAAASIAGEIFQAPATIFLPDDGKISFRRRTSDQLLVPSGEEAAAQMAFDRGMKTGSGMKDFPEARALYIPLRGAREALGVLSILPDAEGRIFAPEQQSLLEVFASQTALAIERILSQRTAEEARLRMETEQMRSSLLSAVSHDLRTPLASITGAASTLSSQGNKLPAEVRRELLQGISDDAERLSRLVGNLLDMIRFESGAVELRRDLYPLEEIVGAALQRLELQIEHRTVSTTLPDGLPPVYVDDVLLGQVVLNLIENALKYTPDGTPIEIAAEAEGNFVVLEIRDRGPGLEPGEEERIFQKFYRGRNKKIRGGVRGAGLGLAICRAIMEAHMGSIEAFNRAGGGAVFRVRLPAGSAP